MEINIDIPKTTKSPYRSCGPVPVVKEDAWGLLLAVFTMFVWSKVIGQLVSEQVDTILPILFQIFSSPSFINMHLFARRTARIIPLCPHYLHFATCCR